jgi:hypothetical protein
MWDTTIPPFAPEKTVKSLLSVWDYSMLGGRYFTYLTHWPYHAAVYLASFALPVGIANTVVYWFLYFVAGFSMYIFVADSLPFAFKNRLLISLISALFYMLNPYWIFRVNSVSITIWILSLLPLLMFLLRRALLA